MMTKIALIDGDVIKYAAGFACELPYWSIFDPVDNTRLGKLTAKKANSGKGVMEVFDVDTRAILWVGKFRSRKAAVQEYCDNAFSSIKMKEGIHYEPIKNCLHSVKGMIRNCLSKTGSTQYRVYLSGKTNYRTEIYPEYKANRKNNPKPHYAEEIMEFIMEHHNGILVESVEADDAMGIDSMEWRSQGWHPYICTIDKDLDMIPGGHYNWGKDTVYEMDEIDCWRCFYQQLLKGDNVDNIPGIKGYGDKTAEKALAGCTDKEGMHDAVKIIYKDKYGDEAEAHLKLRSRLLWILRKPLNETYPEGYML